MHNNKFYNPFSEIMSYEDIAAFCNENTDSSSAEYYLLCTLLIYLFSSVPAENFTLENLVKLLEEYKNACLDGVSEVFTYKIKDFVKYDKAAEIYWNLYKERIKQGKLLDKDCRIKITENLLEILKEKYIIRRKNW